MGKTNNAIGEAFAYGREANGRAMHTRRIDHGDVRVTVGYSYSTPVAAIFALDGRVYVLTTTRHYSKTTAKHVGMYRHAAHMGNRFGLPATADMLASLAAGANPRTVLPAAVAMRAQEIAGEWQRANVSKYSEGAYRLAGPWWAVKDGNAWAVGKAGILDKHDKPVERFRSLRAAKQWAYGVTFGDTHTTRDDYDNGFTLDIAQGIVYHHGHDIEVSANLERAPVAKGAI